MQVPNLRKQAEATLLEFRRSPNPVHACQHILEHSGSLPARFQVNLVQIWNGSFGVSARSHLFYINVMCLQAALTLREAALRGWGVTSAEEKRQLRSYILHFILRFDCIPACMLTHYSPTESMSHHRPEKTLCFVQKWEHSGRHYHLSAYSGDCQHAEEGVAGKQQGRAACIFRGS